jgi:hypothetical protein
VHFASDLTRNKLAEFAFTPSSRHAGGKSRPLRLMQLYIVFWLLCNALAKMNTQSEFELRYRKNRFENPA